ncbi:MAG TPA: response regulator [Anaeromyxobacteraceae bacterium]|nr:response regulator [Anaeromyxobacteraceae bacterium]
MADERHVLLVEDDPDIRTAVAEIATDAGFRVTEAIDGLAALQLIDAGLRPSVILLDLTMPRMDGTTFLAEVRERHREEVPVVVVTAAAELPAGTRATATIFKPFTMEELEEVLERVTSAAR